MTSLLHLTYEGRRYEIDSGTFNDDEVDNQHFTAEQVIVKRCPLFRQAEYVSHVQFLQMATRPDRSDYYF